ncbi:MAG TPA: Ig-like domain-containing protein [Gemmatimonadaceae bacterium]|nr:Ig-like domain-containing protein [Gemmatimonadaceae bacterium]
MRSVTHVLARLTALGAAAALAAACGSDNNPSGPAAVASIALSPANDTVTTGATAQFAATPKDASGNEVSGQTITWTSSDTDAAPVSASGLISAMLPGTATVTAAVGSITSTAQLTILPSAAIQLAEGQTVGDSAFASGDTPNGGQGSPVGIVPCGADASAPAEHIHSHLTLIANGQQVAIPLAIGVMNPQNVTNDAGTVVLAGTCFYWIHTHDRTGIIHVEPTEAGHTFTLGDFFDIWGEPLGSDGVAGYSGTVTTYVDGHRFTGDPRTIVLAEKQQITIEVGTPLVAPPIYAYPNNY